MKSITRTTRRGLTILELMLALTITVVIGAGLVSVISMISQVTTFDRDSRTGSLRAHAVQIRLHAYTDTGLCILQTNNVGEFALWLEDNNSDGAVNLSEFRVFLLGEDGSMICERLDMPDAWTEEQIALYDIVLPSSSDFFVVMEQQRTADMTSSVVIADGLSQASLQFDTAQPIDAKRLLLSFQQDFTSGAQTDSLIALALTNHQVPEI